MGSSGWVLELNPIAGVKQATNAAVRKTVSHAIAAMWRRELPNWSRHAIDWILFGEDSLLTVQDNRELRAPATELTFWFYGTVDWPSELADHWLRLVLAWRRPEFESVMAKLGFLVDDDAWPSITEKPSNLFVEHEGRVGQVGRFEDDSISWQIAHKGVELGELPVAELPQEMQEKLATGACLCPWCTRHPIMLETLNETPLRARTGHELKQIFVSNRIYKALAPHTGGVIAVGGAHPWNAWGARSDAKSSWHTLETLTHPKRKIDVLHDVAGTLVAILGYNSPKPARVASISTDGGVTWSAPAPTGLPEIRYPKFLTNPHCKELVFAVAGNAKQMFRSDDGGRTFGSAIEPTMNGQSPKAIFEMLPCGGRLLAQWQRTAKLPTELAASDDGGATFKPITPTGLTNIAVWGTQSGDVVVIGNRGETQVCVRTSDGGQTWIETGWPKTAHAVYLGKRWFAVETNVGLHVSDDNGGTWVQVLDGEIQAVYPDEANSNFCYVSMWNILFHVVIGPIVRHNALEF